jgi:hypothetical protein
VGIDDGTTNVTSVSDILGNSFQLAVGPTRSDGGGSCGDLKPQTQALYYASGVDGGSEVVAASLSALTFVDMRVLEYSGVALENPLDAVAVGIGVSPVATSAALETHSCGELLIAAATASCFVLDGGAGFTLRDVTPDGDMEEDAIATFPGTYSATANSISGSWVIQLAAFRAAPP